MTKFELYRGCLTSSIEGNLVPCCNEDPRGREGGHVFEMLSDIQRRPFQQFRFGGLSIVDISTDAVVHICPKRSNEGPAVTQRKSLWSKLANLHVEGDHPIVVDLFRGKENIISYLLQQVGIKGLFRSSEV